MKKICSLLITGILFITQVYAQTDIPNREFRAAWIATVSSLDWPHTTGESAQKEELKTLLDDLKDAGINAVFFQIRTECDAFYNSNYEPWSRWLTGTQGEDPGYDPLAFAIEEAHKRGIELHAWMNPYRARESGASFSADHISNTHPEWVINYDNGDRILDPGLPAVRDYIIDVVEDVVSNYAVDGIHFDDYFYSYGGTTDEDAATFLEYGDEFSVVGDWRRDNINQMIAGVFNAIKAQNEAIRFGVSPFGIWKNGVPNGITGMNAYDRIYADALHWLDNQTVDYLTPQLYWKIGGPQDFGTLLPWWADHALAAGRHLYAGHGTYKLRPPSGVSYGHSIATYESETINSKEQSPFARTEEQFTAQEIPNQVEVVRDNRDKNALGSVFFRAEDLQLNLLGVTDIFKSETFPRPAIPPAMPWLPEMKPAAPQNFTATVDEGSGDVQVQWERDAANTHDFKRYAIYILDDAEGTLSPTDAVADVVTTEDATIPFDIVPPGTSFWTVVEIGLTNTASDMSNIVAVESTVPEVTIPVITLPVAQESTSEETFLRFEWEGQEAAAHYHYQLATDAGFASLLDENSALDGTVTARLFANMEPNTYYFRIRATNGEDWTDWSETFTVHLEETVTGTDLKEYVKSMRVYPNPSSRNQWVTLNMQLTRSSEISVVLTGVAGTAQPTIVAQHFDAGEHSVRINCNNLAKGVYIINVRGSNFQETKRLVIQ